MIKFFLTLALIAFSFVTFSQSTVYVNGYYRSNGTYVQPHYRTSPNSTVYDNWSTYPNVNPYTGSVGTRYYQYNSGYPSYNYSNSYYNSGYNSSNSTYQYPQFNSNFNGYWRTN
jgi:hypothetical protein